MSPEIRSILGLAVLTLPFNLDIGFCAITIGLALSLVAPTLQRKAITLVTWPEIVLITGVSTYVGVMEKMGAVTYVADGVAVLASLLTAALLLCDAFFKQLLAYGAPGHDHRAVCGVVPVRGVVRKSGACRTELVIPRLVRGIQP